MTQLSASAVNLVAASLLSQHCRLYPGRGEGDDHRGAWVKSMSKGKMTASCGASWWSWCLSELPRQAAQGTQAAHRRHPSCGSAFPSSVSPPLLVAKTHPAVDLLLLPSVPRCPLRQGSDTLHYKVNIARSATVRSARLPILTRTQFSGRPKCVSPLPGGH